ncbi:MAG: hypothetical protein AAB842_02630 [Patescibacteria group bacterium]
MRNHNDKNNSSMWWMMMLCALPLIIILITSGNFSQGGYLWPILIGGFMVAHFWIMIRSHHSHNTNHDEHKNQKLRGGGRCH